VLKTANFLGEQTAGTVFQIIAVTGINIKDYSAIPGEDEVVLPPGTQFVVDKITSTSIYEEVGQYMEMMAP